MKLIRGLLDLFSSWSKAGFTAGALEEMTLGSGRILVFIVGTGIGINCLGTGSRLPNL